MKRTKRCTLIYSSGPRKFCWDIWRALEADGDDPCRGPHKNIVRPGWCNNAPWKDKTSIYSGRRNRHCEPHSKIVKDLIVKWRQWSHFQNYNCWYFTAKEEIVQWISHHWTSTSGFGIFVSWVREREVNKILGRGNCFHNWHKESCADHAQIGANFINEVAATISETDKPWLARQAKLERILRIFSDDEHIEQRRRGNWYWEWNGWAPGEWNAKCISLSTQFLENKWAVLSLLGKGSEVRVFGAAVLNRIWEYLQSARNGSQ